MFLPSLATAGPRLPVGQGRPAPQDQYYYLMTIKLRHKMAFLPFPDMQVAICRTSRDVAFVC